MLSTFYIWKSRLKTYHVEQREVSWFISRRLRWAIQISFKEFKNLYFKLKSIFTFQRKNYAGGEQAPWRFCVWHIIELWNHIWQDLDLWQDSSWDKPVLQLSFSARSLYWQVRSGDFFADYLLEFCASI